MRSCQLDLVAFADFFTSVMAFTAFFTYAAEFDWQLWIQIDKKIPKNCPKSSRQLRDFSVMFLTENQLFGSSAGSDLQAISLLSFSDTILFVNQKGPRLYVQLQKQSIFFLSSVSFHSFIQFQSDFHMSGSGIQKPTWQTLWKLTWAIRKLKLVTCTIQSTKLGWISSLDLSYRVSAWWHSMFFSSKR